MAEEKEIRTNYSVSQQLNGTSSATSQNTNIGIVHIRLAIAINDQLAVVVGSHKSIMHHLQQQFTEHEEHYSVAGWL